MVCYINRQWPKIREECHHSDDYQHFHILKFTILWGLWVSANFPLHCSCNVSIHCIMLPNELLANWLCWTSINIMSALICIICMEVNLRHPLLSFGNSDACVLVMWWWICRYIVTHSTQRIHLRFVTFLYFAQHRQQKLMFSINLLHRSFFDWLIHTKFTFYAERNFHQHRSTTQHILEGRATLFMHDMIPCRIDLNLIVLLPVFKAYNELYYEWCIAFLFYPCW